MHSRNRVVRIDPTSTQLALDIIRKHLGANAHVWLFGSRADDTKKGGDIDLFVETDVTNSALPRARARGELADALGRHVALVVSNRTPDRDEPIFEIARTQGVRLT